MSVIQDYYNVQSQVRHKIELLNVKIISHSVEFTKDRGNYGFIGDLNRVLTELKQLNESLS